MLLSDRDLSREIDAGNLRLDPFAPELLQPSSIDVRLDRLFGVFNNHLYTHIDPAVRQDDLTTRVEVTDGEPFVLHPGEFVLGSTLEVITLGDRLAGRLEGKALALDTEVPTPSGWRTMGGLVVGDEVFDEHGRPTPIVAATPPLVGDECYEVEFSDGSVVVADGDHQWLTTTKSERKHGKPPRIRATRTIAMELRIGNEWNHHVPLAEPAHYPRADLPVDPYVLGAWLGDGTSAAAEITCAPADASILEQVRDNKHIPEVYLRSGVDQRLALLQGLMDTDGCCDELGRCEFISTRESLALAVAELAASVGIRPKVRTKTARLNGVSHGPAFQVKFVPHLPVFRLPRKLARQRTARSHSFRAVVAVRPVPSRPVRCIEVAAPSGLFLVGRRYLPTHNSSLGRLGLLTHSTAGFVDPGFSGHVTLELSNVATLPIKLWPGMKIGQLCIFRLSSPAANPYGSAVYGSRYQDQRGPTPSRAWQNWRTWPTR